jgi:hypothetical protein
MSPSRSTNWPRPGCWSRKANKERSTVSTGAVGKPDPQELMTLFNRVDIKAGHIEIRVYRQGLHDLLQTQSIDSLAPPRASRGKPDDILRLKVKAQLQRVGREMKLVVHNADDLTVADPGLLRIAARAHVSCQAHAINDNVATKIVESRRFVSSLDSPSHLAALGGACLAGADALSLGPRAPQTR